LAAREGAVKLGAQVEKKSPGGLSGVIVADLGGSKNRRKMFGKSSAFREGPACQGVKFGLRAGFSRGKKAKHWITESPKKRFVDWGNGKKKKKEKGKGTSDVYRGDAPLGKKHKEIKRGLKKKKTLNNQRREKR